MLYLIKNTQSNYQSFYTIYYFPCQVININVIQYTLKNKNDNIHKQRRKVYGKQKTERNYKGNGNLGWFNGGKRVKMIIKKTIESYYRKTLLVLDILIRHLFMSFVA